MEERKNPGGAETSSILAIAGRSAKTPAPGAISSPQAPGQVPDRSTIPGQFSTRVPRALNVRRPLVQYGTAEEIMKTFAKHGQEIAPEQFEQATASIEEMRKANPADVPPVRPVPGYVLDRYEAAEQLAAESEANEF